jgi:hypothetical protein
LTSSNIKLNPLRQRQPRGVVDRIRLASHIGLLEIRSEFFGAFNQILKVACTIAENKEIRVEHLAEAIQYRNLDREGWAGQTNLRIFLAWEVFFFQNQLYLAKEIYQN